MTTSTELRACGHLSPSRARGTTASLIAARSRRYSAGPSPRSGWSSTSMSWRTNADATSLLATTRRTEPSTSWMPMIRPVLTGDATRSRDASIRARRADTPAVPAPCSPAWLSPGSPGSASGSDPASGSTAAPGSAARMACPEVACLNSVSWPSTGNVSPSTGSHQPTISAPVVSRYSTSSSRKVTGAPSSQKRSLTSPCRTTWRPRRSSQPREMGHSGISELATRPLPRVAAFPSVTWCHESCAGGPRPAGPVAAA